MVRVAFSILAFALQWDRTYVVVTLIVLGVLIYSLAGGSLYIKAEGIGVPWGMEIFGTKRETLADEVSMAKMG